MKALKARFKPVDIEELRGLEFHQLMQTDESVEKQLMQLARKAFPSLGEKELDRLLKGRFFQAALRKDTSSAAVQREWTGVRRQGSRPARESPRLLL